MTEILTEIRQMTTIQRIALIEETLGLIRDEVPQDPSAEKPPADDAPPAMPPILIRDSAPPMLSGLAESLRLDGYPVREASDDESGAVAIQSQVQVVLELILPARGGHPMPILMVTAQVKEGAPVTDREIETGDEGSRPLPELLARLTALLTAVKPAGPPSGKICFSDVVINLATHRATRGGKSVQMSTREFDLVRYLWENRSSPLSRETILGAVWEKGYAGTARTVDNFLTRLRQKFEPSPSDPIYFQTVRGIGYCFVVDE